MVMITSSVIRGIYSPFEQDIENEVISREQFV